MLYMLVALFFTELLRAIAELGGADILDAAMLYTLVALAELRVAGIFDAAGPKCLSPWTSWSRRSPPRSLVAWASLTPPHSTCWSPRTSRSGCSPSRRSAAKAP